MKAPSHVFVGPHPEVLADGTPAGRGAMVTPDPDNQRDAAMIARGWLVPLTIKITHDDGPSLKDLQDEAEDLGIAKSGTKAELAERIADHKAPLTPNEEQS